jgi:hypothetical protein
MKRVNIWQLAVLVLAATALLVSQLKAQTQEKGRRGRNTAAGSIFGRGNLNAAALVSMEQVQKELNLTEEQITEFQKITVEMPGLADLRDLSEDKRRAKLLEIQKQIMAANDEAKRKIEEILLPDQRDRLDQIMLQLQGDRALSSDKWATKLGLSDEQRKQIQEAQDAQDERVRRSIEEPRKDDSRQEMQKHRNETRRKIRDVLTNEQRQKLTELKGKPFKLAPSNYRGPRDRGPRTRQDAQ